MFLVPNQQWIYNPHLLFSWVLLPWRAVLGWVKNSGLDWGYFSTWRDENLLLFHCLFINNDERGYWFALITALYFHCTFPISLLLRLLLLSVLLSFSNTSWVLQTWTLITETRRLQSSFDNCVVYHRVSLQPAFVFSFPPVPPFVAYGQ